MDIKTLVLALALGNLSLCAALLFFEYDAKKSLTWSVWAIAKQCQAAAWFLMYLRGIVPDAVSIALGYRADKFINIPNGYALEKLKPDAHARHVIREELEIANDAFVLGMVARFDPQKDHQNLIGAFDQYC